MPFENKKISGRVLEPQKPWSRRFIEATAHWLHMKFPTPMSRAAEAQSIRVVCISDTHGTTPDLPHGDILLHAGDLSNKGSFEEVQAQLDWLNSQQHAFKVVIAGNHDIILDDAAVGKKREAGSPLFSLDERRSKNLQWGDVIYLENSSTSLEFPNRSRSVKIFGSPMTPDCGQWAFQYLPIRDVWRGKIASNTDIVMTHGPPKSHLDSNYIGRSAGCSHLLRALHQARPRLHVFGHIHESHGKKIMRFDAARVAYENIVILGGGLSDLVVLFLTLIARLFYRKPEQDTMLVNAAMVCGSQNSEKLAAIVVHI